MPFHSHLRDHIQSIFHHHHKMELNEHASLYLTNTIRVLATSLIGVFLPIYIFTLSGDYMYFSDVAIINGLSWVLSYYLLRAVVAWLVLLLFGNAIFSRLHFQLTMVISFVLLIFEIILWHLSSYNLFLIMAAGLLAGVKVIFYWVPYHIFFLRKAGKASKKMGKKTSMRFFLSRIITGIAPAIGGLIIVEYGFGALFTTSILLLLAAALPIVFVVHDWHHKKHNAIKVLKKAFFQKSLRRYSFAHFGEGMETYIYAVFWPILLYFALDNFAKVGFINSISYLLSSVIILFIGKLIDTKGTKKIHTFGSVLNAFFYVPRMFLQTPFLFYAMDITDRFVSGTYTLPIMSLSYENARKYGVSDYIILRELSIHLGAIFVISIIMVGLNFLLLWKWVFLFAMVGTLLTLLIEKRD